MYLSRLDPGVCPPLPGTHPEYRMTLVYFDWLEMLKQIGVTIAPYRNSMTNGRTIFGFKANENL